MTDFPWHQFESNTWKPENQGDTIVGEIARLRIEQNRKGEPVPVLTLATDDGERDVWASAIDLRTKLAEAAPQVGDRVALRLEGTKSTGQPQPMKLFGVKVQHRPAGAPQAPQEAPAPAMSPDPQQWGPADDESF